MKSKLNILKLHPLRLSVTVLVALVGSYLLVITHAQTPAVSLSAASGTVTGGATSSQCANSTDTCVVFSGSAGVPTPTNLQVIDTSTTQVSLTWSAPTGWTAGTNNLTGYNVYRDGTLIATTKPFTTNYLDTSLNPGSTHNYTVQAMVGSSTSSQTAAVSATLGSSAIDVSTCPSDNGSSISSGGNYVLTSDIQAANIYCFNVGSTSTVNNFNLDCQGHSIINSTSNTDSLVYFLNVNHSMVVNCHFMTTNNGVGGNGVTLGSGVNGTTDNNYDTIENNTLGNSSSLNNINAQDISLSNNSDSVIDNNTIYDGEISEAVSSSSAGSGVVNTNDINGNTISTCGLPSTITCSAGMNVSGTNVTVAYNNIDGNGQDDETQTGPYTYQLNESGVDDGIVPLNTTNLAIENNTISNTWDCGIETSNVNNNLDISNNVITNTIVCGIGGWYWTDITNANIANNVVHNSEWLFDFYWDFDGTWQSSYARTYHFLNVSFIGNSTNGQLPTNYINDPQSGVSGSYIDFVNNAAANLGVTLDTGNLLFKNNIFTATGDTQVNPAPFAPISSMIDGGGNQWCPNQAPMVDSSFCNQ